MKSSTHKLVKAIAVVVASAGFAVPAAGAATSDAFQRAVNIHNAAAYPDAVGRAVNIHTAAAPDAFGRAFNIHSAALQVSASQVARVLGTPDTRDAAQVARMPVIQIAGRGFDWGDAGIGAGSGIGLLLLLGAAGSVLLRQKQHLSRA